MGPETSPNARDLALRRLTVREYSSVELMGYLRRKGIAESEAQAVVKELEEQGLIDPDRYAAAIARSQIARGKGPMAVLDKLRRRGLRADLNLARKLYETEAAGQASSVEGVDIPPEVDAIRKVISSRFPQADFSDRKVVARIYRALLRRGFSASAVRTTLDLAD